jgi:hypothetical protein
MVDLSVAFALIDRNDADHVRWFLGNLKARGLMPRVVVTDGSNPYPELLAELWPEADHQLCIFRVHRGDQRPLVLDAVGRLRAAMARRGKAGWKKKKTAR